MGWLRLVGCLKIQVSLQNTGLFCRALLQKRPIFLSILLIVATPYRLLSRLICGLDDMVSCVCGILPHTATYTHTQIMSTDTRE